MIKVTTRVNADVPKSSIVEHKSGSIAQVYNGVLTIYSEVDKDTSKPEPHLAVAGYEPGSWLSWEKV